VRVSDFIVKIIPIKKKINNDLFIDRTEGLYLGKTRIRDTTNEGDLRKGILRLEEHICAVKNCPVDIEGCGIKRSGDNPLYDIRQTGIWRNVI